jgi:hypothetical protein
MPADIVPFPVRRPPRLGQSPPGGAEASCHPFAVALPSPDQAVAAVAPSSLPPAPRRGEPTPRRPVTGELPPCA